MNEELHELLANQLYDLVPFNVAIIDREFNIVQANNFFRQYFGDWEGKKCYQVYKKRADQCSSCEINNVFKFGTPRVSNESGIDKNDKICHYIIQSAPLKDKTGEVKYIVEMSTDITETTRFQREYNIFFENVPSYLSIIDKEYKIVRANKKLRQTFGEIKGKHCFEVYKKRNKRCRRCPAAQTFRDGLDHMSTEIGLTFSGEETKYIVNTTALSKNDKGVQLVIEICTDITEITELQETLRKSHDFYATLIENSEDGILATNESNKTVVFNESAKKILNWTSNKKPVFNKLKEILPQEFFGKPNKKGNIARKEETTVIDSKNKEIPVRFNAIELRSNKDFLGRVAFFQDLRQLKELEKQRIEAERLGAVGQTVAGLAHTIKNVLMGLEGGMYIVDTGLRQGNAARIVEGWEILQRNFNKTTELVKGFLGFAKGRLPELIPTDPNKIVEDIIELYRETAKVQNVELTANLGKSSYLFPLDPDGIESCLTNLVSNSIDAAMMREDKSGKVEIKTRFKHATLVFEVSDNGCGMDSEVIQKIFTTFFTTKGNKGTGLGLLTVNKIVKEHGGTLEVESEPDKGSTFRMIFPLKRLEMLAKESKKILKI
ncbi:MAG: Histidine kinase protein [Bacteroidota bacterium]|nr:Histidine kinase protein [Bacteroidota bacterium]